MNSTGARTGRSSDQNEAMCTKNIRKDNILFCASCITLSSPRLRELDTNSPSLIAIFLKKNLSDCRIDCHSQVGSGQNIISEVRGFSRDTSFVSVDIGHCAKSALSWVGLQ